MDHKCECEQWLNRSSLRHCVEVWNISGDACSGWCCGNNSTVLHGGILLPVHGTGPDAALYGFTPSGALIKAMLIASAQPLTDVFQSLNMEVDYGATHTTPSPLAKPPSYDQGYGRIQLNQVLHNGNSTTNPISLFVIGNVDSSGPHFAQLVNQSQSITYTFTTGYNPTSIKIVLAYTTPVPAAGALSDNILNQLTLSSPGLQTLAQAANIPYSRAIDPVSVIVISKPRAVQQYPVTVTATSIAQPQLFALVIVGDITDFSSTPLSKSYATSKKSLQSVPFYSAVVVMAVFSSIIAVVNIPLWYIYLRNHPPQCLLLKSFMKEDP